MIMKKEFNQEKALTELMKGSKPAFESIFRLYYPRLKKYAGLMLNDKIEAEDLVQDVFYQVWKNRESLKLEKQFSSFVFTILRNRCLNILKRRVIQDKIAVSQSKLETEELYHISFQEEGHFISMEEKLTLELEGLLVDLPERCGEACRLKWIDGRKNHEIAAIMEISTTMVDKHLSRGLQAARSRMNPEMFIFFVTSRN